MLPGYHRSPVEVKPAGKPTGLQVKYNHIFTKETLYMERLKVYHNPG